MNVNRVLEVGERGAAGAFQDFLSKLWAQNGLEAMLAPCVLPERARVSTRLVRAPGELTQVNPFVPLMQNNAASSAWECIQKEEFNRVAFILRPCELRALVELVKKGDRSGTAALAGGVDRSDRLVTIIGVDCLGTFPPEAEELSNLEVAIRETLRNAAAGGLTPSVFGWPARCAIGLRREARIS